MRIVSMLACTSKPQSSYLALEPMLPYLKGHRLFSRDPQGTTAAATDAPFILRGNHSAQEFLSRRIDPKDRGYRRIGKRQIEDRPPAFILGCDVAAVARTLQGKIAL